MTCTLELGWWPFMSSPDNTACFITDKGLEALPPIVFHLNVCQARMHTKCNTADHQQLGLGARALRPVEPWCVLLNVFADVPENRCRHPGGRPYSKRQNVRT